MNLTAEFWENKYSQEQTGWDIGSPSTPLVAYADQLKDKELKILIPGCGNAYEGEYLYNKGFKNLYLSDYAASALNGFKERVPLFPDENILIADFFKLEGSYDLIIEQTFYCALDPSLRDDYVKQMFDLLNPGGKLVGLLFDFPLTKQGPPFGGSLEEYKKRFSKYFKLKTLEPAYNSIKPRAGSEVFIIAEKV